MRAVDGVGWFKGVVVISDDEENPVSPPVAAVLPDAEHGWPSTADWSEDEDVPRPDWLPDVRLRHGGLP